MCGIAGVVFDAPRDEAEILRMVRAMCEAERHRGPDGQELWTNGRVGLGMVRLAVVGSADRGRQPIKDEQGCQLVFNGELYEPARVMSSLGGYFDKEDCDGTALLRLLRARGVTGLRDVGAMFSLALYDPRADEVLLARDAWGEKPLYMTHIAGGLAFASTIAALHTVSGPLSIRAGAMQECLIFKSVGGNQSAFEDVSQLPAGSWMRVARDGTLESGRWLEVRDPGAPAERSEEIRERLVQAITSRCGDRYRNAVFLSGGLDSSIVATVAGRYGQPRPASSPSGTMWVDGRTSIASPSGWPTSLACTMNSFRSIPSRFRSCCATPQLRWRILSMTRLWCRPWRLRGLRQRRPRWC